MSNVLQETFSPEARELASLLNFIASSWLAENFDHTEHAEILNTALTLSLATSLCATVTAEGAESYEEAFGDIEVDMDIFLRRKFNKAVEYMLSSDVAKAQFERNSQQ